MRRQFPFGVELVTEGELASHTHAINSYTATGGSLLSLVDNQAAPRDGWKTDDIKATGGDQPHNTIQPVYGVYRYERVS